MGSACNASARMKIMGYSKIVSQHEYFTMPTTEELNSVKELFDILANTRRIDIDKPTSKDKIFFGHCDEVSPNIFIGSRSTAKNKQFLKEIGITHVVNTAQGTSESMVDTNQDFYSDIGIKYHGFEILDLPVSNISLHFYEVSDFINEALKGGGKVLVHCMMGLSRSATCVLAHLMIKEGLTAAEAVKQVRQNRFIKPNEGFLLQLVQLEKKLQNERYKPTIHSRL